MWGTYFDQLDCTIWAETGDEIDVYAGYERLSGSCQCYGNCDCSNDRGKVVALGFLFRATALRDATRKGGKEVKKCKTLDIAVGQLYARLG